MLSIWKSDIPNKVNDMMREKDSIRHKRYYEQNRKKILRKQKKNDELRDRKTYSKKYYLAHKDEINEKNKERYQRDKLKRITDAKRYYDLHKEEIAKRRKQLREMKKEKLMSFVNEVELGRSAVGNIKNHTWSVHPYYKVYEDEGNAIVAYVDSLKDKIKELEGKENK